MSITLKTAEKTDYKQIKKLYVNAFPPEERPPFFMLKRGEKRGFGDMLTAWDGDEFIGFVYLVVGDDTAYLFFLAIDENKRGRGYGSDILGAVAKIYKEKKIFLAREQLDEAAENYEERVRRHSFYLKNGFVDLPIKIKEASVTYDVMGIGGNVTSEEYDKLITHWCGKFMRKFVDMRIIE